MENYLEGLVTLDPRKEVDHRDYHDHLLAFNDVLNGRVSEGLIRALSDVDPKEEFYVATTGSDARHEKGTISPVELILYIKGEQPSEGLLKKIQDFVWGPTAMGRTDFDQYVETKSLSKGNINTTVFGASSDNPRIMTSPNRFLDSQIAYTRSLGLYNAFWEEFARRICDGEGRDILEEMRSKVKNHKHCTTSGTQMYGGERKTHYDLNTGTVFYDPGNGVYSFKQGPIRLIQFALGRDKIAALRDGLPHNTLYDLPSNTALQLNQILVRGLTELSPTEISDLVDSYKYFLWQYQISQARHAEGEHTGSFDPKIVTARLEDVARICSNGNNGKPNRRIVRYKK